MHSGCFHEMHFEYNKMNFNRPWTRDFQHDKGEAIYIQFLQALSEQKTGNSSATDSVLIEEVPPPTESLMNCQKNGGVLNKLERTNDTESTLTTG